MDHRRAYTATGQWQLQATRNSPAAEKIVYMNAAGVQFADLSPVEIDQLRGRIKERLDDFGDSAEVRRQRGKPPRHQIAP
jgi:hypothetical protein